MLLPWAFSLSNSTLFTSPSKFPWRRSLISSKSEVFVWTYCQVTPVAINIVVLLLRVAKGYPQFSRSSLGTPGTIASHADALSGSSRVPFPREEGTRDEPITASAWEATGTMTHQFSLPRSADDNLRSGVFFWERRRETGEGKKYAWYLYWTRCQPPPNLNKLSCGLAVILWANQYSPEVTTYL